MADSSDPLAPFNLPATGLEAYKAAATKDPRGFLTPEQLNIAFRTKFGTDAPSNYVSMFTGNGNYSGTDKDAGFFNRVQNGDFMVTTDDRSRQESLPYLKNSAAELARQQYLKAVEPSARSMAGEIPEITQKFNTERDRLSGESGRLEDRYKLLIDDIKRNQGAAETRQTRTSGAELARRGITNTSGVYDQEMTAGLNPITEAYTSQLRGTGLDREDGLAKIRDLISGLTTQETSAQRAVRQAIADLATGASTRGLDAGRQDYQTNIQNQLAQVQQNLREREFNEVTLPASKQSIETAKAKATSTSTMEDYWKTLGFS